MEVGDAAWEAVIGLETHVQLGTKSKIFSQASTAFGDNPNTHIDPIVCGASIIQNIQHIVSRNADPKETLVITVATFSSGKANNVIPSNAKMSGTIRYYNKEIGWVELVYYNNTY